MSFPLTPLYLPLRALTHTTSRYGRQIGNKRKIAASQAFMRCLHLRYVNQVILIISIRDFKIYLASKHDVTHRITV